MSTEASQHTDVFVHQMVVTEKEDICRKLWKVSGDRTANVDSNPS